MELAKRSPATPRGPCQARLCQLPGVRLHARETGTDEAAVGTTTARPPWQPVSLGLLAGRGHEPAMRTSIHHRHEEHGATMMWTGGGGGAPPSRHPPPGGAAGPRSGGGGGGAPPREALVRG